MHYRLKHLTSLHSLPFCTPDGRMAMTTGLDDSGVYLYLPFDYLPAVPASPTADQVRTALKVLVGPWRAYNYSSADDAAAMVSAVLAAVCRPVLDLCPAVLFEASSQGTGKTLAATALGSLMTGRLEGVTPFSGFDDDELRKRFTAGVLTGQQFHCMDNLVGHVASPALAALLTTGRLQDRVLGSSRNVDAAIRSLITFTANNASLSADLLRRTVRVRFDSGVNPIARRFDFSPPDEVLRNRLKIAEAACTIWRGYLNAGSPQIASDDAGGYRQWVRLCRQPVLWLVQEGLTDGLGWQLGDPAACLLTPAESVDPEVQAHGDMLRALWALTEGADFTARQGVAWIKAGRDDDDDDPYGALREAVREMVPGRDDIKARSLGKVLAFRRDRVIGGLALRKRAETRDGCWWAVERVS